MKPTPWVVSLAVHAAVLFLGGLFLRQEVVYGLASGKSSTEVDLIAAAPDPTPASPVVRTPEPVLPPDPTPDPDAMITQAEPPKPTPTPPVPPPPVPPPKPAPPSTQPPTPEKGDGSAPKPGKSATTMHSDAGALPTVNPDYLSNPAPVYPEEARRARQEGLVLLDVIVGTDGRAEMAEVRTGSGFPLLDQSALKAVRGWRFRPATSAGIKIRSHVQIPVRFRLDG